MSSANWMSFRHGSMVIWVLGWQCDFVHSLTMMFHVTRVLVRVIWAIETCRFLTMVTFIIFGAEVSGISYAFLRLNSLFRLSL